MAFLDLLLFFAVISSFVSGQSTNFGLKGLKVNLKPNVNEHPDEILWKHNGNKVIEFDGKEEQVYDVYENRVTLDWVSAELSISNLRYEDSGEYEVETYTKKVFDHTAFKLEVIDKVAKPTISCQRDNGSSSTTHGNQATLSCSAESRQPQYLQYEWISHGTSQPVQKLTITLRDDNEEYSCRVSNPLTSETTKFTAKDCNSDESSSIAWIAVPIFAVILVVVLIVAGILYCKGKQKACFTKGNTDDVEKQSQPDTTEGSNKRRPQNEENHPLLQPQYKDSYTEEGLDKKADSDKKITFPPSKSLNNVPGSNKVDSSASEKTPEPEPDPAGLDKKADSDRKTTSPPLGRKTSYSEHLNKVPGSYKDYADTDQHKEPDSSASEKTPEPEPEPAGLDNKADSGTKTTSPPLGKKPSYSEGLNKVPGSNKVDADTDQHKEPDSSASEKTHEPEPDPAGSNKEKPQNEENVPPPHRAPKVNSGQQLVILPQSNGNMNPNDSDRNHTEDRKSNTEQSEHNMSGKVSDKPSFGKGLNKLPGSNKEDADTDQHKEPDSSASEKTHEPEPDPDGLDKKSDSDKRTTSPPLGKKPSYSEGLNNVPGSNKDNADTDQHKEPDSSASEKTPEPEPDPAGELDCSEDLQSSSAPDQPDQEKTPDEDGEAESPTANVVSPPLPEPCSQEEEHLVENNHHIDKSVSKNENESGNDQKETNKGKNLSSDSDHHPSPTEADHSKTDTYEDSPDSAHSESEQEKDQSDSDEGEVQSDSSSAKTDNREDEGETDENEDQSSLKEKQTDSDSEDKEQEKAGEAAE